MGAMRTIHLPSMTYPDSPGPDRLRGPARSPPEPPLTSPIPLPKARLEALTDGIFAVTMTLLVLDLRFPHALDRQETFLSVTAAIVDRFDNYVISFVALCVFWLSHLRLMRRLNDPDEAFVWLNLAFLLLTTLVPTLSAFVGENPAHPRAAVLYGTNLVGIIVFEALMWRRMCLRLSNDRATVGADLWRTMRVRFATAIAIVAAGILIALVEIRLGVTEGFAPYVYLLLLASGVLRPLVSKAHRKRG